MFNDAADPREGVWIRIVFKPPKDKPYRSKVAIIDQLDKKDPITKDIALQFVVASDLFGLNDTRFSLQNNTRTGHQAFAVLLPIAQRDASEISTSIDTQELDPPIPIFSLNLKRSLKPQKWKHLLLSQKYLNL